MKKTFPFFGMTTSRTANSSISSGWSVGFRRIPLLVSMLFIGSTPSVLAQSLSASMSFPQFNSSYLSGTPINIQATATTPAGTTVTKVEFYFDTGFFPSASGGNSPTYGTKIGEDLTAPYSINWTVPAVPTSRSYQLRAVVVNSAGNAVIQSGTGWTGISVYAPTYVSTRNWYVNASAPATNTAGTEALPLNTIQKAADRVAPGDTVFVMAGRYMSSTSIAVVGIQRTGTPARPIVFMPYRTDKPVVALGNTNFEGFRVLPAAAYIRIQGFEVIGNNANITLEQARQQPGACEGPNPAGIGTARFNGNGISLIGNRGGNLRPHHVVIAGNTVHDCAGGGIGGGECDYVTIENNVVYNTSWYTIYGTSGLNIINAWNYDGHTDGTPSIIIRNNRSFGNMLKIAWNIGGTGTNCKFYDGNGIILDNNKAVDPNRPTVVKNALGDYTGKFLIENNLCYQNGGRGINVNYSDNATIINNTTYQNGVSDGGPGVGIESEFIAQGATNINVYNNIFYGRPGEKATEVNSSTIAHNNNLTFEGTGTPYFSGSQNITGQDPLFANAAGGDFSLSATSPALNAGSSAPGQYSTKDILGINRPQGAGVDIGAYELQGTPISITRQPASSSAVCAGTAVSVSVSAEGPVQTYQWYKDGPSGVPVALTGVASATTASLSLSNVSTIDAGAYSVLITGFNSLTSTAFSLTVNTIPTASLSASETISCNQASVTLSATGGLVGATYAFRPGVQTSSPTSATASVSQEGHYTVTVTNPGGCSATASTTVTGNITPPTVSISPSATAICQDQSATLSVTPGLSSYRWNSPNGEPEQTTASISVTASGTYSVTATGTNGCSATATAQVTVNALPTPLILGLASSLCQTSNPVTLSGSPAGGSFTIDSSPISTLSPASLSVGQHTVVYTYTNPSGCWATATQSVTIKPTPAAPGILTQSEQSGQLYAGGQASVTLPQYSGTVILLISGCTGTLNWQGPGGTSGSSTSISLSTTATGTFVYSATCQQEGCPSAPGSATVVVQSAPLSMVAPLYDCQTRQLTLRTTGGNGEPIECQIASLTTGWESVGSAFTVKDKHLGKSLKLRARQRSAGGGYIEVETGFTPTACGSARESVSVEPGTSLSVVVLGNPVTDSEVRVEVRGAQGQPLRLSLTNLQGQSVGEWGVGQAGAVERHVFDLRRAAAGILLLRVSTNRQTELVKVLKQ